MEFSALCLQIYTLQLCKCQEPFDIYLVRRALWPALSLCILYWIMFWNYQGISFHSLLSIAPSVRAMPHSRTTDSTINPILETSKENAHLPQDFVFQEEVILSSGDPFPSLGKLICWIDQ